MLNRRAVQMWQLFCCLSLLHSHIALCQKNQAVSPPPSIFEWLQPFRPIITVSKFPPIVEFIAQRIQAQFSNYIYEDLSRPQTYDRPTYKPYVASSSTSTTKAQNGDNSSSEEDSITTTTEYFMFSTNSPPKLVLVDQYELTSTPNFNQTVEIEYQLRNVIKINKTIDNKTNKIELEQAVHLIMQENNLKENFTHVFEKFDLENEENESLLSYKDVSSLFSNNIDDDIVEYVLRDDRNPIKNKVNEKNNAKNRNLIALTKIGNHVYVNVINFKCQPKT